MDVRLVRAGRGDVQTLQSLFQLYTHDFSEFWAGLDRGELNEDGRFPDYPLDAYWDAPGRAAYLLGVGEALAGFALVNEMTHSGRPADQSVAEFFVVRKHRGSGVAREAARQLFATAQGLWEVAIARKNARALRFWKTVVVDAANGVVEELDLHGPDWDGPILRFRV